MPETSVTANTSGSVPEESSPDERVGRIEGLIAIRKEAKLRLNWECREWKKHIEEEDSRKRSERRRSFSTGSYVSESRSRLLITRSIRAKA